MDQSFDPINIILLVAAIAVFFKLRSVLGSRDGFERRDDPMRQPRNDGDNVIPLPSNKRSEPDSIIDDDDAEVKPVWQGLADEGSDLALQLEALAEREPGFDPANFVEGAKIAYEMIVTSFAKGEKKVLKNLLSSDVYNGFASAIDERNADENRMESNFVGIDKAKLIGAALNGSKGQMTIRFSSQLVTVTYDKNGAVIDGDPDHVLQRADMWTFERDFPSRDPNWILVVTEEAA